MTDRLKIELLFSLIKLYKAFLNSCIPSFFIATEGALKVNSFLEFQLEYFEQTSKDRS